jgi:RNA polymerase sigma factor (sigma-70 family)
LEKETWVHISEGDKTAYGECYTYYYKRLFNYGRKFTADIPLLEDALQESLLSLWTGRERLSTIESPHSYLFASFRYILFRKIKEAGRARPFLGSEEAEPEFGIEHLIIDREEQESLRLQLEQAIKALTPRQREAIFLRFFEGLSYEEVAGVLGISVKATYKIMARALDSLKTGLSLSMLILLLLLRNSFLRVG